MTPTTKRCAGRCGRELPADVEHFHRHARSRDGLHPRCRDCRAADRRDERLVARLGRSDVTTMANAYRKGRQEGAAAAVEAMRRSGRLLPSDTEEAAAVAAEAQAQHVVAVADEVLARITRPPTCKHPYSERG